MQQNISKSAQQDIRASRSRALDLEVKSGATKYGSALAGLGLAAYAAVRGHNVIPDNTLEIFQYASAVVITGLGIYGGREFAQQSREHDQYAQDLAEYYANVETAEHISE
jgi:hypothetical protein